MTIIVPESIKKVKEDIIKTLSPQARVQYYDKLILDILRANADGVTAPEVQSATGFHRNTISQHLARLVERGQATAHHRGKLTLYYPNGEEVGKPFVIESKTKDGLQYVITKLKRKASISYYIQQKELDAFRALRVKGGITVSSGDLHNFIKSFHTYALKEKS